LIVLLNPSVTAAPSSVIAIALETVGDGVTGVRGLRQVNDPTVPSALAGMAEKAGRPDMASHGNGTERHMRRSQYPPGRVRPI
jgi:hypothetical protein